MGLTVSMLLSGTGTAVYAQTASDFTITAGVGKIIDDKEGTREGALVIASSKTGTSKGAGTITREKKSHENMIVLAENDPTETTEETGSKDPSSEEKKENEKNSHPTTDSTVKETISTSNPAILTVGVESDIESETISETVILDDSANLEIYDIQEEDEESDGSEDEDDVDDIDVIALARGERNTEEEDFTNLVIARVNDYVNVRSEASEDSEVVGKLYNKSVGDLIEEEGDWYKIKSGNCTGYVKSEYVVTGEDAIALAKEVGTRMAVVTTTTLYVRKEATTEAEVIGMVPIEDELLVIEEEDGWVKVSVEEGDGYVSDEYVRLYTDFVRAESKEEEERRLAREEAERKAAEEAARKAREKQQAKNNSKKPKNNGGGSSGGSSGAGASYAVSGSGTGSSVASFALKFVGNPYVYGGSSLTNGTDCSGFVMSVYRNFGVSLPHSSGGDRSVGRDVGGIANAQAGDIVCYSGHVGIYIGGGQIVHASTPSSGIKVSNANYRQILAVRRVF